MRRYWFDNEMEEGQKITISGDLFKHIFLVCRQNVGDHFELINKKSKAFKVVVNSVEKKQATVQVVDQRQIPPLPKPYIHLYLCIPKFNKFELILEKAVELGVKQLTPIFSEFSYVRSMDKIGDSKWKRWQKIIGSATQQSGRGDWMELSEPLPLLSGFERINLQSNVAGLFPYEGDCDLSLRQALNQGELGRKEEICLFVGSEGGFSLQEVESAKKLGLQPFSLGDQVLRVETACVALMGILKYELNLF